MVFGNRAESHMFAWCIPGVARCLFQVVQLVGETMAQGGMVGVGGMAVAAQMSVYNLKVQQIFP